jgi:four helix bundle protein
MNPEELKRRTKRFAHGCVKLSMTMQNGQLERHVRGQLIRCSTSVAANYRAACLAQSRAGFTAKISIVLEEADESAFWLEFALDESILETRSADPLLNEARELSSIFFATRRTTRDKG